MSSPKTLSVVVAVWRNASNLAGCLEALAGQAGASTEVAVVSSFEPPRAVVDAHRGFHFLTREGALTPELWAAGMAATSAPIVAITTAHFTPSASWLREIREAHARLGAAGVGGVVDPPERGGPVAWATWFLRYAGSYSGAESGEREASDLVGDNASYDRAALEAHWGSIEKGFWEPEFHRLVRSDGRKLWVVPRIRVTQRGTFGFAGFCRQRLLHGRHFGAERVAGKPAGERLFRILTSPLVPAVLLAKVTARAARGRRFLGPFLVSLPALAAFVLSWSAGEAWGYLSPRP